MHSGEYFITVQQPFYSKNQCFLAYRTFFNILHYKMACFGRLWCATCTVDRCCQTGNVHVKCEISHFTCTFPRVCGGVSPSQLTRGRLLIIGTTVHSVFNFHAAEI